MSQLRKNKGKKGEEQAAKFLQMFGWELLEQNYRHGRGEIDLIFLENERILVFVEVKTRKNAKFGFAEDNISPAQQVKIYEAAENYIHAINWQGDIRFDVLAIVESSGEIHHAKDAFYL